MVNYVVTTKPNLPGDLGSAYAEIVKQTNRANEYLGEIKTLTSRENVMLKRELMLYETIERMLETIQKQTLPVKPRYSPARPRNG